MQLQSIAEGFASATIRLGWDKKQTDKKNQELSNKIVRSLGDKFKFFLIIAFKSNWVIDQLSLLECGQDECSFLVWSAEQNWEIELSSDGSGCGAVIWSLAEWKLGQMRLPPVITYHLKISLQATSTLEN